MIVVEHMNPGFTKFQLDRVGVLHRFHKPETGLPHDHPADFTSEVLLGSYVEEVFTPSGQATRVHRKTGDRFEVKAEHIHRIVELPEGECWTFVEFGPHRREWRSYEFAA